MKLPELLGHVRTLLAAKGSQSSGVLRCALTLLRLALSGHAVAAPAQYLPPLLALLRQTERAALHVARPVGEAEAAAEDLASTFEDA